MKQLEYPVAFIHQNMVFNKRKQVWAFYKLEEEYIRLNSDMDFRQYVERTAAFLSHEEYDYHIMIFPKRFDFEKFTDVINRQVVQGEFADIGQTYFQRACNILKEEVFLHEYDVYVAIYLNKSDAVISTDVFDFTKKFVKRVRDDLSKMMLMDTSEDDVSYYEELERALFMSLSYDKQIRKVQRKEIERVMYYLFHRTSDLFEIPDSEYNLTEGIIKNEAGYMTVRHQEYTEYVAFLPFHKMPHSIKDYRFIQNIIEQIDFPLEIQIKYSFKPNDTNIHKTRQLRKRFTNFDREIKSTMNADDDAVVEKASERLSLLMDDLKAGNRNLLYMNIILVISDQNKEELERKYETLQNIFRHSDFELVRPMVDQLTLFSLTLPGSTTEYNYFEQVVDQTYLAQSAMDLSNKIGNRFGMVLGKVITGRKLSSVEQARDINNNIVIFNPLLTKKAIKGAAHTNGNILITGPPGSGKSMLVKNFFTWSTFFGSKVLYVDPKNEFQNYYRDALAGYGDIPEFRALYERINFIHLSEETQYHGALDPLVFLDGDQAIQTAMMILNTLAEIRSNRNESVVIYESIIQEVEDKKKPTLTGVLERIMEKDKTLGRYIEKYRHGLGRMLFGNPQSKGLDFQQQVNVLGLQGLRLPASENMNEEERIGLCLMMAISKYVHIFSTKKDEEAMIIFDEAWTLRQSQNGQQLIDEMLRTGRSLQTDIVLVTQAYDDFNVDTTKEQIGVKFAFRPKSDESIKPILGFFDLEENKANIEVVSNLKAGMCLFQDHLGRNQAIAVDILFEEWMEAFKTTKKESSAVQLEEAFN